jgi:hypothetical protein
MDPSSTNPADRDQADEDILTDDVSDEALEAAAIPLGGPRSITSGLILPLDCC